MTENPSFELTQMADHLAHDYDCDCEDCDGDTNEDSAPMARVHLQMLRPHLESKPDAARTRRVVSVVRQAEHKGKA